MDDSNTNRNYVIDAARHHLDNLEVEKHILLIPKQNQVKIIEISENSTGNSVGYSRDLLFSAVEEMKNETVYSAHNHPSGNLSPSTGDYWANKELKSILRLNHSLLAEEFIVANGQISSFDHSDVSSPQRMVYIENNKNYNFDASYEHLNVPNSFMNKNELEDFILDKLNKGFEVAVSKNLVTVKFRFSFKELLGATDNLNEVIIWAVPNFQSRPQWERICDIDVVFGSIEFYSNYSTGELNPLKKSLLL